MAQLNNISWYEFQNEYASSDFFILPVGSIEQHGKHLPLGTDTMVAEGFANRLATIRKAVVLPAVQLGVVFKYQGWPGTISLEADLFQQLIFQIGKGLHNNNVKKLLIISGHDENKELLVTVAQKLNASFELDVIVAEWAHIALEELCDLLSSENEIHGGELLTSLMLHWHADLVKMPLAKDQSEKRSSLVSDFHGLQNVFRTQRVSFNGMNSNGVSGFPSKASKEKGERIEQIVIQKLIDILQKASW